jgi:hypothetical protein
VPDISLSTVIWIGFGWLLCGASAFGLTWLVRAGVGLISKPFAEGEAFKVALRFFAVLFGVVVGYLGRGSLFPGLQGLPAALLGGLAGFGARDAYDAYKALRGEVKGVAQARLKALGGGKADSGGA